MMRLFEEASSFSSCGTVKRRNSSHTRWGALAEALEDQEITCLFQSAAWVVLCFAPRGTRPPEVLPEALEDSLNRQVKKIAGWSEAEFDQAFTGWLAQSRQPELLTLVLALTLGWLEKAPPGLKVRDGAKSLMIAALGAVVDTLDEAARSGSDY